MKNNDKIASNVTITMKLLLSTSVRKMYEKRKILFYFMEIK